MLPLFLSQLVLGQEYFQYKVTGIISDLNREGEQVYLLKRSLSSGFFIFDSTSINKGKFKFRGTLGKSPDLYKIRTLGKVVDLILEPGHIQIEMTKDSVKVAGTPMNDDYYKNITLPANQLYTFVEKNALNQVGRSEIIGEDGRYRQKFDKLNNAFKIQRLRFVEAYAEYSVIDHLVLDMIMTKSETDHKISEIWERLSAESKQRLEPLILKYHQMLNIRNKEMAVQSKIEDQQATPERVRVGQKYIDFKGLGLNGDTLQLSSMITNKKLVLIDFWASWCGPCMKELPVIDSIYHHYRSKGLEVIGVSVDHKLDAWKQAILKHQMDWQQMRVFKDTSERAGDNLYGVFSIPYTILINKEGIIVARRLRGDELWQEVRKHLVD